MRVVVFGATGRTGRLLVEGALARGHDVTAFVRAPDKLGVLRDRVRVAQGDVLDGGAVSDAVDGQEAALVALGVAMKKGDPAVNAQGTLNVIRSMPGSSNASSSRSFSSMRSPTCGAWRRASDRVNSTGRSCARRAA
jgi:putative NADH-flavin reductase